MRKFHAVLTVILAVTGLSVTAATGHATGTPAAHPYVNDAPRLSHGIPGSLTGFYHWPESSVNGGNSGYNVDDTGNGGNGTQQQVWTSNNNSQQDWYLFQVTYNGSIYYEIVNANGKCIDDENDNGTNGTKVQIWTCNGLTSQLWYYNKYSGSDGNLAMWLNYNGVCLDDQHPYTDGGKIQMWQCAFPPHNDNAEAWQVPAATW